MMVPTIEFAILVGAFTAAAAVIDIRLHRIPNYLTVPAALAGLAYHSLMPTGMGPWMSLAGFAVGFSLLLAPWLLGGGGMGDVKLLAALGTWLGPLMVLVAFGASAILAGMLAIGIMIGHTLRDGVSQTKRRFLATTGSQKRKPRRVLPFAVPVAMSTWMMLIWFVARNNLLSP